MNSTTIEQLHDRLTIAEVCHLLDLPAPRNRSMRCPIPDHEDRHPSASIYRNGDGTEQWWCHVCARGGDVVDLTSVAAGMPAREAVRWLATRAGIPLVRTHRGQHRARRPQTIVPPAQLLRKALEKALLHSNLLLKPTPSTMSVFDYVYGELDWMRRRWDEERAPDDTRLRALAEWRAWALGLVRAAGVAEIQRHERENREATWRA